MVSIVQEDRLQVALERLVSNGPAIAEGLRQAGYRSLALQLEHDVEAIRTLGTGGFSSGVEYNLGPGPGREETDGESD